MLVEQSAEQLLRVSMELGGNAPFLVFADADVDKAVEGAMLAKMRNIGEACTAANRFYVHESVAEEFTTKFAARMAATVVGKGTEDGVTVGPLIDAKAVAKVTELSTTPSPRARGSSPAESRDGGRLLLLADRPRGRAAHRADAEGGDLRPGGPDHHLPRRRRGRADGQRHGVRPRRLPVHPRPRRAVTVSEQLEYGMVGVNQGIVSNPAAPFGGVKQSGFGREGGLEGIEEYLETKYVGIAL